MISFQNFCNEHGGRPVTVDGRLLFADGLMMDLEAQYVLAPVPTDRIGKAKARRRFLTGERASEPFLTGSVC